MRVALFITCLTDTLFPRVGQATVELLERLGCTVEFPEEQTCCGQMHLNSGYGREALPLVERFVRTFAPYELVVTPSGSCAAMVREHYVEIARSAHDAVLEREASALVPRVYELSELLTGPLEREDVGASFPRRVTYHPSCHGLRQLRLGDRPLRLLRAVRGIDLIELGRAEECCGFGGTFALKNAAVSVAMLDDKLRCVDETGADVLTAGDSSCLMHMAGALQRRGSAIEVMHLAEILNARGEA